MKTIRHFATLILTLSICLACLGMLSIGNIPKEKAAEWGVTLRATPNGPKEAWIQLKFKPEGKFAGFSHVSLEIADGGQFQLGWTALKDEKTADGTVVVNLMGNRTFLEKVRLRIVCNPDIGHDVSIKDYVDFKNLR